MAYLDTQMIVWELFFALCLGTLFLVLFVPFLVELITIIKRRRDGNR